MAPEEQALALRLVFAAYYAAGVAATWRKADVWHPFSPVRSDVPGHWVAWRDALRWALSALFLVLLPALFLLCIILVLSQPRLLNVQFLPPSARDAAKFLVVMSLITVPLGLYDIWQAIMRSLPDVFYPPSAQDRIRNEYPNAFGPGRGTTLAWALVWIFIPVGLLTLLVVTD